MQYEQAQSGSKSGVMMTELEGLRGPFHSFKPFNLRKLAFVSE